MDSDEIERAGRLMDEPPDDYVPEPDWTVAWELLDDDYEWTETL